MTAHVDRLLAAYVNGHLPPQDAARVYLHTRSCPVCLAKLIRYENLSDELRRSLSVSLVASPADVQRWWHRIKYTKSTHRASKPYAAALAPALLTVLLLALPIFSGMRDAANSASVTQQGWSPTMQQVSEAVPSIGATPAPYAETQFAALSATQSPVEDVITAAPAPLAPAAGNPTP